jgi:hypothetical protein
MHKTTMVELQPAITGAWHGFNPIRVNRGEYQIGKSTSMAPDNRRGRRKQRNSAIQSMLFRVVFDKSILERGFKSLLQIRIVFYEPARVTLLSH